MRENGAHASGATGTGPGLPRAARVTDVRRENERTVTIRLNAATHATPGQFAMLWLPGLDEKPFSFMNDDPLAFTIAAVGPFSRAIQRLAPGDRLWWRGPFGRGFGQPSDGAVLVGGGYGVAPLLFLARRTPGRGLRVAVGARTAADLLLVEDFRSLGVTVVTATEDGTAGTEGLVTRAVELMARDRPIDGLFACGPHGMLAAVEALARDLGVAVDLAWEAYMRCGLGICGSCEHDGWLLCADGPVLRSPAAAEDGS